VPSEGYLPEDNPGFSLTGECGFATNKVGEACEFRLGALLRSLGFSTKGELLCEKLSCSETIILPNP
jgi:hypothetical protein